MKCRYRWLRAPATKKPRYPNRIAGSLFSASIRLHLYRKHTASGVKPSRDARSRPVRAGVEDGTNWAGAPSWCEARGGGSEASRSSHDGRRVTKGVAPVVGQRIKRVAAGGGAHPKFHNLKAATWNGGGGRQQGVVDCRREPSPGAPAEPERATVQGSMHSVRRDASAWREGRNRMGIGGRRCGR